MLSVLLSLYSEVKLLNHVVILFWQLGWGGKPPYCLTFPPAGIKVPTSPYPHQHLLLCVCLFHSSHPNRCEVVVICISLISGAKHILMCLLAIWIPYLEKYLSPLWASLVAQMVKCMPTIQESRVWSLGQEDPLEKEMATHSSTLAWKIPWMEESGGLQSMGLQRDTTEWLHFLSFTFKVLYSFFNQVVVDL